MIIDPATALTAAIDNSTKVANTPLFTTIIDKMVGFKISEWKAQGDTIKKQILDGYDDAKSKGLGIQYVSAFRSNTNLINICTKAAKYINSQAENNMDIDNDVFWGLIDHAKTISSDEMQDLIAKVLAGEYNTPGTYSMSTLQILKSLGKDELEKFAFMASFYLPEQGFIKDFFTMTKESIAVRKEVGLRYNDFLEMQNLGLIQSGDYTVTITLKKDSLTEFPYPRGFIVVKADKDLIDWRFPSCYELTTAGKQILQHLDIHESAPFKAWLGEFLRQQGLIIQQ